jgi:CheY-like chemotaxis protein
MNDRASILIVDDEEVVRHSHLRSLADTGCHAEAAEDGRQAIRVMEQHPFDVVLLDLRMPGLDGMDVLKTIKERWPEANEAMTQKRWALRSEKSLHIDRGQEVNHENQSTSTCHR